MTTGIALFVLAIAWWLGVEIYRGQSRSHSVFIFWLHLSAPIVAMVLMGIGFWLSIQHIRSHGKHAAVAAPPTPSTPIEEPKPRMDQPSGFTERAEKR